MNHRKAHRLLSAYLDRELAYGGAVGVSEHLLSCPACQAEAVALLEIKTALAGIPKRRIPEYLLGEIEARTIRKPWWPGSRAHRYFLPSALAVATAFGALWLMKSYRRPSPKAALPIAAHSDFGKHPNVACIKDDQTNKGGRT
jgi:anti-sigma factor RsiW